MPDAIYPVYAQLDDNAKERILSDYQISPEPDQHFQFMVIGKMTEENFHNLFGPDKNIAVHLSTITDSPTQGDVTINMSVVASEENPDGVQARLIARFADQTSVKEDILQENAREIVDLKPEIALKLIEIGCDLPPGSLDHATQKTLDQVIKKKDITLDDLVYTEHLDQEE